MAGLHWFFAVPLAAAATAFWVGLVLAVIVAVMIGAYLLSDDRDMEGY